MRGDFRWTWKGGQATLCLTGIRFSGWTPRDGTVSAWCPRLAPREGGETVKGGKARDLGCDGSDTSEAAVGGGLGVPTTLAGSKPGKESGSSSEVRPCERR